MYLVPQLRGDEKVKYLRKSRTDDALLTVEEVLAKHEQMLDEWVMNNQPEGGKIPEENTFREVVSGETLASRPQMMQLLKLIESPKIKAIVCVEPQRLSRGDYEDIGRLVKLLRYTNTLVITLQYTYDLNDERDRDLFERALKRGNEFLEYQKRIMGNGRLLAVENGNFLGSIAPYGYQKVKYKEGKRNCHTLEPIPDEANTVKRIFELYKNGIGATRIAFMLDAEHIPSPKGKEWSAETILMILENIHYLGKIKWNWRKTVNKVIDGDILKTRPKAEEYLVFEGKHPAIVDQETWDAVKDIRGKHPRNHKAKNLTNPLAGLLYCQCGRAMVGRKYNDKNGNERCLPRFLCQRRTTCQTPSATFPEVIDEVIKVLECAVEDFEIKIDNGKDDSAEVHKQLVERLEKRLDELRKKEVQQWEEKMQHNMPEHVFKKINEKTVKEIEEVHEALCEAQGSTPEPINLQEKLTTFKEALKAIQDTEAPIKEKNTLLKACIERIEYDRKPKKGHKRWGESNPVILHFTLRV